MCVCMYIDVYTDYKDTVADFGEIWTRINICPIDVYKDV